MVADVAQGSLLRIDRLLGDLDPALWNSGKRAA